jgi:hypothetical protein
MIEKFFYRLNNFLILVILFYAGFFLYGSFQSANSQDPAPQEKTNTGPIISIPSFIINKEIDIDINPGEFIAGYKSDGANGQLSGDQLSRYVGDTATVELIDIPIRFEFDKENSKLITPGEVVYPAIRKATAPTNFRCQPLGPNGETTQENADNCLFNVQSLSVFTDIQTSIVTIGDRQFIVDTSNPTFFDNLLGNIRRAFDGLVKTIAAEVGLTDQGRTTIGTIRYWGSDNFQQFVPINDNPIFVAAGITEQTGVNQNEGAFASDLSTLDGRISATYKAPNIVYANLNEIGGPGQIYDPFTAPKEEEEQSKEFFNLVYFLTLKVTGNSQEFAQTQQRLSSQVAIRGISEAEEYGVSYKLCDAIEQGNFGYSNYPNPYRRNNGINICADENGINDRRCTRYEGLPPKIKRCISAVAERVGEDVARKCAEGLANGQEGCNEFSVEESELELSQMEKAFPIGYAGFFQNATLANLDPRDKTGPYINYLSPYFCAKLNIAYKLTPGRNYIYDIRVESEGVETSRIGFAENFKRSDVANQYCVLGGIISNFGWAMTQQANNFSSTVTNGTINLPREALTCDKKETAIFGAVHVKSNRYGEGYQPIYVVDDNTRGDGKGNEKTFNGNVVKDEVSIFQGYNSYPITELYSDPNFDGSFVERYAEKYDMVVITDPITSKPKYTAITLAGGDDLRLLLCKIPTNRPGDIRKEKSLCKVVESGGFVFAEGASIVRNRVTDPQGKIYTFDSISLVFRRPGGPGEKEVPYAYRIVDVVDENDINASFVSDRWELPFLTKIDPLELKSGELAVGGINLTEGVGITYLGVSKINPSINLNNVTFDNKGPDGSSLNIQNIRRDRADIPLSGNLCNNSGGNNYCRVLSSLAHTEGVKIAQNPIDRSINLAVVNSGFGLVYPLSSTGINQTPRANVFAYNTNSSGFADAIEEISAMKINSVGEIDIFLGRSGGHIRLVSPEFELPEIRNRVQTLCGTNCYIAIQKDFKPELFETDCSDYKGAGACGYPKLQKIETPIVRDFIYSGSGKIMAWYTYRGIDKTLFQSPDYLYAFSPLYRNVPGENNQEFSNAYIPVAKPVSSAERGVVIAPQAEPIRFYNFTSGGLLVGRELENRGGVIKDLPNRNPEKLDCLRIYTNNVSGIDLYFGDTGLSQLNLNATSLSSTPLLPTSPIDGTKSSANTGEYCEETWCIPDEVSFINNPRYRGDKDNVELKRKIVDYLINRDPFREARRSEYERRVDFMCELTSERGMPCALLAATWMQESSGRLSVPVAFGCFDGTSSFEDQARCARNTIYNRASEYDRGLNVLTGPGSELTPSNGGNINGSCVSATRFSHTFQRYTPIDRRINVDNQCNKGLVLRPDQDALPADPRTGIFPRCVRDFAPSNASGNKDYSVAWPKGELTGSRINLQRALIALAPELNPKNNLCFPNPNRSTIDNSTGSADINTVLADYDTSITQQKGRFRMNLRGWGMSDSAGNVYMALNEDWQGNGRNMLGAHIIRPGQSWSFNQQLNFLNNYTKGQNVDLSPLIAKYSQVKAPWNTGPFNYANRRSVIGGGWCELATTIRMAATRLVAGDGTRLEDKRFTSTSNLPDPKPSRTYGTGAGWYGHINHWTHSGVNEETFNAKLGSSDSEGNYRLTSGEASKYVAIWIEAGSGNRPYMSRGDLTIINPYAEGSNIDLIITIQLDEKGMITVEALFGRKRSQQTGPF